MKKINISHIESKLFNKRNLSVWWDLEKYPYPLFTPKKEEKYKGNLNKSKAQEVYK